MIGALAAWATGCSTFGTGSTAADNGAGQTGQQLVNALLRARSRGVGVLDAKYGTVRRKDAESGEFLDDRRAVIGWFTDTEAVKRWYYSHEHRQALKRAIFPLAPALIPELRFNPPLQHVDPNYAGPVMVVASFSAAASRFSPPDFSIELFTPLPGGLARGPHHFSPPDFGIPGFNDRGETDWSATDYSKEAPRRLIVKGMVKHDSPNFAASLRPASDGTTRTATLVLDLELRDSGGNYDAGRVWIPAEYVLPDYSGGYTEVEIRFGGQSQLVPIREAGARK